MAKKIPVIICSPKHTPSMDPKFHIWVIFDGAGKSMSVEFTMFKRDRKSVV